MELFNFFENSSFDVFVISFITFILTMIVKIPIKRATAKFNENKRKALNSVIIPIPIIFSYVISTIFYGIQYNVWFSYEILECSLKAYLIVLTVYTIYQRMIILVKGFMSEKTLNSNEVVDAVLFAQNTIKNLNLAIKDNDGQLKKVSKEIYNLLSIKNKVQSDLSEYDFKDINDIDNKISELEEQEYRLKKLINIEQNEINEIKQKLKQEELNKKINSSK